MCVSLIVYQVAASTSRSLICFLWMLVINNNIHQVEGTIVAMEGPGSGTELKSEWLQFKDLYNFSMVGNGKINGRGKRWWGQACRATSNVCILQSLDKFQYTWMTNVSHCWKFKNLMYVEKFQENHKHFLLWGSWILTKCALLGKTEKLTKILVRDVIHEGNKTHHRNKTVQNLDRSMRHQCQSLLRIESLM